MLIFCTSDWHLGNTFHGYDRDEEHRHFLDWLLSQLEAHQPDALLVSGDVFDTVNPSAFSQKLYYRFLAEASQQVEGLQIVIIAGNHDSAYRLEAPNELLQLFNVHVRGVVSHREDRSIDFQKLVIPLSHRNADCEQQVLCLAAPFLRQGDYPPATSYALSMKQFFDELAQEGIRQRTHNQAMMLMAHFYATGAEIGEDSSERIVVGGSECVDTSDFPPQIAYTALGHIHKRQQVGRNEKMRYCGSALPMSFTERHYKHGIDSIRLEAEQPAEINFIEYEPQHPLLTLPRGSALPLNEVFQILKSELRDKEQQPDETSWPYLEIKVLLKTVDPTMPRQIQEAIENKAVRFCTLKSVYEVAPSAEGESTTRTTQSLNSVLPLDVARSLWRSRNQSEMPAHYEIMFNKAYEAAKTRNDEDTTD